MAHIPVDTLAGLPLFYDRFDNAAYGNKANRFMPFMEKEFADSCNACLGNMQIALSKAGLEIREIWSGGVARKGRGKSYHHTNRAFDLDALKFSDGRIWVANTFPEKPFLYLAIEGCLRLYFGTVLNYDYDVRHRDHFHFDNGTPVKFKRDARSHTLFVQHTLVKLFNEDIGEAGVDGLFGPDTRAALTRARRTLEIGRLTDVANWRQYLTGCVETALANEPGGVLRLNAV